MFSRHEVYAREVSRDGDLFGVEVVKTGFGTVGQYGGGGSGAPGSVNGYCRED